MIRAIYFPDFEDFRGKRMAGSFHVWQPDSDGEAQFWYCCPCGCGLIAPITVGYGSKPAESPSWRFNGSYSEPTLHPSVNHQGHWHGWLRDGYWEAV